MPACSVRRTPQVVRLAGTWPGSSAGIQPLACESVREASLQGERLSGSVAEGGRRHGNDFWDVPVGYRCIPDVGRIPPACIRDDLPGHARRQHAALVKNHGEEGRGRVVVDASEGVRVLSVMERPTKIGFVDDDPYCRVPGSVEALN